jgi:hypothetical protein
MALKVLHDMKETRSGGHRMFMVECDCGKQFPIQFRRIKTQGKCATCSATHKNNLREINWGILEQKLKTAREYLCRIENASDAYSACDLKTINDLCNEALSKISDCGISR